MTLCEAERLEPSRPLRIAVPKGSLFADSVKFLEAVGLDVGNLANPGRHLTVSGKGVDYLIVRPTDIPVFVAYGGADCAIAGKDTLVESALDVAELVDLGFGACRFVVAQPCENDAELRSGTNILRVATKYPRITKEYFGSKGTQVEIIKLHGNIELAPLIGMADCIVDITATGTTLRENDLCVLADVLHSSARFVANPSALRTDVRVTELADKFLQLMDKEI